MSDEKNRALISFRIDECANFTSGLSVKEMRNVFIEFEKTVLSIGMGEMHYGCHGFQGTEPDRESVEIAIMDKGSDKFVTRQFFERCMGKTLHDDVECIKTSTIFQIMHKLSGWDPYDCEAFLDSIEGVD